MDTPAVKAWKAQKLAKFGYDPAQFDLQPDGTVVPIAPSAVEVAPRAGDSPLATAAKSAAWSLPDVAGGLLGAGAAAQGLSLAADATGVGLPVGIAGHAIGGLAMLAGGALGAYGMNKAKNAVAPGIAQNVAESAELNPRAATVGNVGAQLLGMTPSLSVARAAGGGLRNLATGVPMAGKEIEALANVGVGGAISGGMNVGQQLAGDEPFSAAELAGETLLGGALHQPTRLGTKLSLGTFKPFVENRTDFVRQGKDVMADARGEAPVTYTDEIRAGDAGRLAATDQQLGLPRAPGEAWADYARRLAAERHATVVNPAKVVDPAGAERYGYGGGQRDDAGIGEIGVGPKAFHNTAPHELIHGYIRDVMQHGSDSERAFLASAAKAVGGEEALAQTGGEAFLRRLAGDDSIIGDITANIRTKLGRATAEDASRLTANRLVRGRGIEGMPLAEAGAERWRARPTSVYTDEQGENPRMQQRPPNAEFQGGSDSPFSTEFEKELTQPRPFRIQVAKDGRMSVNDVRSAVARLNPTEQEMLREGGLDAYLAGNPRPSAAELKAWAAENLPRVEVKELVADPDRIGSSPEHDAAVSELARITHELDTVAGGGWQGRVGTTAFDSNPRFVELSSQYERAQRREAALRPKTIPLDNDSATRRFDGASVNPRQLADMPGAVDLLVRLPRRELGRYKDTKDEFENYKGGPADRIDNPDGTRSLVSKALYSSNHYPQSGDNLLAHVRAYEHTMPDGEKVLRVFELQSDWAQDRRKLEDRLYKRIQQREDGRFSVDGYLQTWDTKDAAFQYLNEVSKGYGAADHPLLPHHQRLALKAAIEHARKRGIKRVVVDDAETAMMTEGHDRIIDRARKDVADANADITEDPRLVSKHLESITKRYKDNGAKFEIQNGKIVMTRGPFEGGMGLSYDNVLQQMLRDLSGDGVRVEMGEHRNAFERDSSFDRPGGTDKDVYTQRPDLIFRNPDGTPKTQSTGFAYDVSAAQARRDAGEPFSYAGRKYQGDQTESPEFANWFGDWRAVRDLNARRAAGETIDPAEFTAALAKRSAVVDGEGRPLRVYHGTQKAGFSSFNMNKTAEMGMHFGTLPQASDFVLDPRDKHSIHDWMDGNNPDIFPALGYWANNRADAILPLYLNIKKPLVTPDVYKTDPSDFLNWALKTKTLSPEIVTDAYELALRHDYQLAWARIKEGLMAQGYDGAKYVNDKEGVRSDPENVAWIAFHPEQIKSATGNRGTFDPTNADVRYQGGTPARDPITGIEVKPWWVRAREAFSNLTEGLPRRMENTGLPNHRYAAGKMRQLVARQREMAAGYNDHVQVELLRLNEAERARLRDVLLTEDGTATPMSMRGTLTNKLKVAYDAVRSTYRKMAEDQIRAGHLLADGTERGVNDQSFPNVLRSDVARVLFNEPGSEQWNRLRSEFIEYNRQRFIDQGMSAVEANEAANSAAEKYSGTMKAPSREASLRFGGTDLPANSKLPAGWIEQDLSRLWERYTQQFARSRARFDVFDADPRMRALTGQSTTANDAAPLPEQLVRDNPSLMTVKDFKTFLDVYERGGMPGSSEAVLPSVGRFVNSLLISGPRTKLTDALTTVFKGLPHVGVRQMPGLVMNIANFRQSLDNSFRNGLNNRTGQIVMREVLGAGEEVANSFDKAAEAVVKYTGSEKLEQLARGLAQNVGEYIARVNKPLAEAGDVRALKLLEHMGPDWRELDNAALGGRIAKLFQGNYDVTNLPPWMFDSPVAPFLTMAKWSVEQTNNFRKFAFEPALQGDYAPMLATLVAGLGGGFALNEMRELLGAKKEQNPTFDELAAATDDSAAAGELFAKFVKYAQITGTLGIVGEMSSQALDAANGRLPQGFRYPVAEFAADSVQRAHSVGSAIAEGESVIDVLAAFAGDMARGHVQMVQFTDGLLGRMGVDVAGSAERVNDANARRDYRVFNRLNGYPSQLSPMRFAPYAGMSQKAFDKAPIEEAARMLPDLIARATDGAAGDPEILRSKLNRLRASSIPGMPSADAAPLRFNKYMRWMQQMAGPQEAEQRVGEYFRTAAERKAKSAMVPRI